MMPLPPLDTSGTRYSVSKLGERSWVFGEWAGFLEKQGLLDLSSFLELSGEVVDRNKRSVVYRLKLGPEQKNFYLKLHNNYFRQNIRTFYRKIPILYVELTNLMHYGRAGIDTLEPVAWGYQSTSSGGFGFILLEELEGFCSLREWLLEPRSYQELKAMTISCATMVRKMHKYGLAHIDLFSWHIFVKKGGTGYEVVPLDLERSKIRSGGVLNSWFIHLKQLHDLAVLDLTVLWPQVSDRLRMLFYVKWLGVKSLTPKQKFQARLILQLAKYLGRKRTKLQRYGVSRRLS